MRVLVGRVKISVNEDGCLKYSHTPQSLGLLSGPRIVDPAVENMRPRNNRGAKAHMYLRPKFRNLRLCFL